MKPVNLNLVRKAKAKADAKRTADANVVKHGRTKAERMLEASKGEQLKRHLDRHEFETD